MNNAFLGAAALDQRLGDPLDDGSALPQQKMLLDDSASAFPADGVNALIMWGAQNSYVPTDQGGDMDDVLQPMLEMRNVARRDLTVAVAHGKTFLGALPSWIAGGDSAATMSEIVKSGHLVSWGLTEPGRGSDLLRSSTSASPDGGNLLLNGEKWPINNATRGRAMSVLVRTQPDLSPRSLSLVLVDKQDIDPQGVTYRPKVRTHGIRGADISGVEWRDVVVSKNSVIGDQGQGLELVLKALQITRPVCTALSLGASDQAINEVLNFVSRRSLYGGAIRNYPGVHFDLGLIVADALVAESTSLVGARHVGALTEELAVVSAFTKFVVPATVDSVFRRATQALGARSQISGLAGTGRFEKANRDNRVVGIFDGNSVVNLHAIINEFLPLSRDSARPIDINELAESLQPGGSPAVLDLDRLRLMTRSGSSLLRAVPELCETLHGTESKMLREVSENFAKATVDVMRTAKTTRPVITPHPAEFELARKLAASFAGACCMLIAITNSTPTALAKNDTWLVAALSRICNLLGRPVNGADTVYRELGAQALEHHKVGTPISLFSGWRAGS